MAKISLYTDCDTSKYTIRNILWSNLIWDSFNYLVERLTSGLDRKVACKYFRNYGVDFFYYVRDVFKAQAFKE